MCDPKSSLSKEEMLQFEDWKMTKDRIKHFDNVLIRLRVQGLPIATAFQIAAFVTIASLGKIEMTFGEINIPIFSLIMVAGIVYLIPVLLLDLLHYRLLILAVKHALHIEESSTFKDNLAITHKLTSHKLTLLHNIGAYLIYFAVFVVGIYFVVSAKDIIGVISSSG